MQKALAEQAQRRQLLEKQLLATKKAVLDRIQRSMEQLLSSAMNSRPATATVRIKAPNWYVNMSGIIPAEVVKKKFSSPESLRQSQPVEKQRKSRQMSFRKTPDYQKLKSVSSERGLLPQRSRYR